MKKGDIVTVVTTVGEFVGKYNTSGGGSITLDDPRIIMRQEDDTFGFARTISITSVRRPSTATFNNYAFVTETNEEVVYGYGLALTETDDEPQVDTEELPESVAPEISDEMLQNPVEVLAEILPKEEESK